jgi:hypothetical protein
MQQQCSSATETRPQQAVVTGLLRAFLAQDSYNRKGQQGVAELALVAHDFSPRSILWRMRMRMRIRIRIVAYA